jgi:crossover junction endodeoxyribonuclease RuvC
MSRLILSCDPGVTGAWSLLTAAGEFIHVDDMPIMQDASTKWVDAEALSSALFQHIAGRETTAVVERVHAMPKNGSVAAFSQGMTLASLLATLQMVRVRIEFVSPGVWKRQLGMVFAKDDGERVRKEASRCKARMLFPAALDRLDRKKDHNRGEALLLGAWYLQHRSIRSAA